MVLSNRSLEDRPARCYVAVLCKTTKRAHKFFSFKRLSYYPLYFLFEYHCSPNNIVFREKLKSYLADRCVLLCVSLKNQHFLFLNDMIRCTRAAYRVHVLVPRTNSPSMNLYRIKYQSWLHQYSPSFWLWLLELAIPSLF